MSRELDTAIAVIGIDIGKNSFHVVGHDKRGAIVLRQKWSRGLAVRYGGALRALGAAAARLHERPPFSLGHGRVRRFVIHVKL
jgi:hypothetical protein